MVNEQHARPDAPDLNSRVWMLEERWVDMRKTMSRVEDDVNYLRRQVGDLVAGARVLRWVIGFAVTMGPAIGVLLTRLFGE